MLEYHGFKTQPEFDGKIYFGKLEGIKDLVTIEAETIADFQHEFQSAVEDYLAFRQNLASQSKAG